MKRFILLVLASALAGVALLAWRNPAAIRSAFMTPLVFTNFVLQKGTWRPLNIVTFAPRREKVVIASPSGRELEASIWFPSRPQNQTAAAVVYTPFIGGGLEDPRLINLAETLARAGIVVLAFFRKVDPLVVSPKDIEDVAAAFIFLSEHPALKPNVKLGMAGISYGNGPVILAAVDPRIREKIDFILSHAGYYDLMEIIRFIVTGKYEYLDIRGEALPNRYGHEILSRTLKHLGVDDARARDFTESPQNFEENLKRIPELNAFIRDLSLVQALERLRARRIYIIHSSDDTFIPYTESLRLADDLRRQAFYGKSDANRVRLQILNVFEHGTPRPPNLENLRRYWIPNFVESLNFLFTLLKEIYE